MSAAASNDHNNLAHIDEDVIRKRVSFIRSKTTVSSRNENDDDDKKKVIHSMKVGIALVLVSLLYLLNSTFKKVGENAMWAIMTVVVVFEFHAGATLSKGINRGIGTLIGGGLGCLAAILADNVGGIISPIIVALSVFAFGACATYLRMVPRMKRRYDYGLMISILTFNLVAVSGVRADKVVELARDRLATIGMGFAICIFVGLFLYPMWASDELHYSTASKFDELATSINGCIDEYFKITSERDNNGTIICSGSDICVEACKSVLNSKSSDDSKANYAKWEPWHGKFGLNYPWDKYIEVGEHLRELAATILLLHACLQSPKQPPPAQRQAMKEPCDIFTSSVACALRQLGESVEKMQICPSNASELKSMKQRLLRNNTFTAAACSSKMETDDGYIAVSSSVFLMMEILEKVAKLAHVVKEMGEYANFKARKIDV